MGGRRNRILHLPLPRQPRLLENPETEEKKEMKDPIVYLTAQIRDQERRITILEAKAQRWMDVAGLMHEYLLEQDVQSAKTVYEETANADIVDKA